MTELQKTIRKIKSKMPAQEIRYGVILQFEGQGIGAGSFPTWQEAYCRALNNARNQGYNPLDIKHVRLLSSSL